MCCSILYAAALVRVLTCGSCTCPAGKIPRLRRTAEEALHRAPDDGLVFLIDGVTHTRTSSRSSPWK